MIQTYSDDPLLCAQFDPDKMFTKFDLQLVKCIHILTAPVRSRQPVLHAATAHSNRCYFMYGRVS